MQDAVYNRMEPTRKRGRPPKAVIEARPAPEPVVVVEVVLPPVQGIKCVACGRGMVPRILRTDPKRRTVNCPFCGRAMTITYSREYPAGTIQLI